MTFNRDSFVPAISPEVQALLLCARTTLPDSAVQSLQALVDAPFNWDRFSALVTHHRVQPLATAALQAVHSDSVPLSYRTQFQQKTQAIAQHSLRLTGLLIRLVQALEQQHVEVLTYKGVALAATVYGNLARRQYADLDLWIAPTHLPRARQIFQQSGLKLQTELSWEETWVHPATHMQVDLHHSISPSFFPLALDFNTAYRRSQVVTFAETATHTLSPEDHLILLCVNLARDYWETFPKLQQLCDIAELLRSTSNLDWEWTFRRAVQLGCKRIMLMGIAVAQDLLNAPVKEPFSTAIAADRQAQLLKIQIAQLLLSPLPNTQKRALSLGVYWQMRERWREKLLYLITPNEDDRNHFQLNIKSPWIYYGVRPIRLVTKLLQSY